MTERQERRRKRATNSRIYIIRKMDKNNFGPIGLKMFIGRSAGRTFLAIIRGRKRGTMRKQEAGDVGKMGGLGFEASRAAKISAFPYSLQTRSPEKLQRGGKLEGQKLRELALAGEQKFSITIKIL